MTDFPKTAFQKLAWAIKSREFTWDVAQAAIEVAQWLIQTGGTLFKASAPAGTLGVNEPPAGVWSDAVAVHHFESLAGDGPQAALDPAVAKAILAYLVQSLLPILMKKLTGN